MSNNKSLLPISELKEFIPDGEVVAPISVVGNPRNYYINLSGSNGKMLFEDRSDLTKTGEQIKLIPIAMRAFEGAAFGLPEKKWVEVFFINKRNQMCVVCFNGHSVTNLSRATKNLRYEQRGLTEAFWTVRIEERRNEKEGAKYFVAEFDLTPMDDKELEVFNEVRKVVVDTHLRIYREKTAGFKTLYSENWSDGIAVITEAEKEADEARTKALNQYFGIAA